MPLMTTIPADGFAQERPRLLGLAYRILGSFGDAEDIVQEGWLRWCQADTATIERPAAWLTTVITRLALDRAKAIKRRREEYVGPWLPEPVAMGPGPEESAEMADSLTLGFLVLLDQLSRVERAVWLLSDVFGEPFAVIAEAVGKNEVACRQIASRARRRMREARRPSTHAVDRAVLAQLVAAVGGGDINRLLTLLDADVVLLSDGGANRQAARHPIVGAERVARFILNLSRRYPAPQVQLGEVNGSAALILTADGMPLVITGEQRDGRIIRLFLVANPDKLGALGSDPPVML